MFYIGASEICSDYVLATILTIVRRGLNLIQIVVPILLIISGTIQFIKLTINPDDDKKGKKNFLNSIMAAVIIFFLPFVVNLTMSVINTSGSVGISDENGLSMLNLSSCWAEVSTTQAVMDSVRENGGSTSSTLSDESKKLLEASGNDLGNIKPGSNIGLGQSGIAGASSDSTTLGKQVISFAKQFIGNPYVSGGNSLVNGTDCSGFIHLIYKNFGIDTPRYSASFLTFGTEVASIDQARAGDIICYKGHVALFEGDGLKIVHAKGKKYGIVEDSTVYYGSKNESSILSIRRVIN